MKKRNIEVEIVADSVNPAGKRITSFLVTYPRFIHAEIMTHRALSRNAASSRAIPISKMIEAVHDNPAIPEWWGAKQRGMQAKTQISQSDREECELIIDDMKKFCIDHVEMLDDLGLHKQIANRYLEPWMPITVLITATEWENFFMLRAHPDAQPEFQILAYRMLDAYLNNKPKDLLWGEWHTPFTEEGFSCSDSLLTESVASCARTSYTTHDKDFTQDQQQKLVDQLKLGGHWSPFEHQAQALAAISNSGNFKGGWFQLRDKIQMNMEKPDINLPELLANKPDWVKL